MMFELYLYSRLLQYPIMIINQIFNLLVSILTELPILLNDLFIFLYRYANNNLKIISTLMYMATCLLCINKYLAYSKGIKNRILRNYFMVNKFFVIIYKIVYVYIVYSISKGSIVVNYNAYLNNLLAALLTNETMLLVLLYTYDIKIINRRLMNCVAYCVLLLSSVLISDCYKGSMLVHLLFYNDFLCDIIQTMLLFCRVRRIYTKYIYSIIKPVLTLVIIYCYIYSMFSVQRINGFTRIISTSPHISKNEIIIPLIYSVYTTFNFIK